MAETTVGKVPIDGGENTSADPTTQATSLVANVSIGPAGENKQRAALVTTGTVIGSSPVIGAAVWRTWVILVTADRKVWAMPEGAPWTVIALSDATAATQLPGTLRPTFSDDAFPRIVIAGGGAPLQWQGVGLCSPLVTVGTPPAATHIAYLAQRFIANNISNPTFLYWSWIGDGQHENWGAEPFTSDAEQADASPDNIVGVYSTVREAYVFGERTLQVYAPTGDVVQGVIFPFTSAITLELGCSAPYSPVNADGAFMFLDDRRRIVFSDGRQFEDRSQDIARTLRGFSTVSDCWSYREDIDNQISYVFRFPTEAREFVHFTDRKCWTERNYYSPTPTRPLLPYQTHAFWPAQNAHVFGATDTGTVYRWDGEAHTDLSQPLVMERVTGWLDFGTRARKRCVRHRLVVRRGEGGAIGPAGLLEVRVADDGGPWGDWERVDLGLAGDGDQNADAFPGGVYRRRRFHYRYSGTSEFALLEAEEHFQECES